MLDSALKVMELYAGHKALLEVEYFNEVGTGLGPTLEFYALVSRELQRTELGLWRHESGGPPPQEGQDGKPQQYVHAPAGLFPAAVKQDAEGGGVPARTLQLFTFMGRFVAKALLDNRLVDLPFSAPLMRAMLGARLGLSDLHELSPQVAASLGQLSQLAERRAAILRGGGSAAEKKQQVAALTLQGCPVAELGLDFTLPGEPSVELCERGAKRDVGIDDLEEYVQAVLDLVLRDGVRAQIDAFRKGFSEVLPAHHLRAFSPEELDVLFNGSRDVWERDAIVESLKFDHGYTRSSGAVGFLLSIMCEFTDAERRQFLKVRGPLPSRPHPLETRTPLPLACPLASHAGSPPSRRARAAVRDRQPPPAGGRPRPDGAPPDHRQEEPRERQLAGRLPAERDDVRQLPQAARLLVQGGDARAAAHRDQRGPRLLPPLVKRRRCGRRAAHARRRTSRSMAGPVRTCGLRTQNCWPAWVLKAVVVLAWMDVPPVMCTTRV